MKNLKPWVKITLIMLLVLGLGVALYQLAPKSTEKTAKTRASKSLFGGGKDVMTIGINTYVGWLQLVWLNNGLEPNEDSPLYQKYGIKAKLVIQDDFLAGRSAFKNGDIDVIYCTTDVLCTEMGENSDMTDARMFMMVDKTRGADVVVVNKNIQSVAGLKNKRVAYAEATVSHSLLLNVLETNNVNPKDVEYIKVDNGEQAAQAFMSGRADACVTWSPIDMDCIDAVPGAKVLISTKQASELSSDGLLAKADYIEKNKEKLVKLASAILYANSMMTNDEAALQEAAQIFSKSFQGFKVEDVLQGSKTVRYVTLGDQLNYFGLNSTFNGVTAEQIYTKMSRVYEDLSLTSRPLPWRKVSDVSIIEAISDVEGKQDAESVARFTAPTKELETKAEISDKKLTIKFPTGSDVLDNDARALIDREFVAIAKQFRDTRIRVEGNTDAVGPADLNKRLSYARAKSVVNYLVNEYEFDVNRFIIVGNGPMHALAAGDYGPNEMYRVTNFQLVVE